MNEKAGEMLPHNIGPIIIVDPPIWGNSVILIAVLITLVLLIWSVVSAFKNREDTRKSEKIKQILRFATAMLFLIGLIDFLVSLADTFQWVANVNSGTNRDCIFATRMAELLHPLIITTGLSGIMFLVSLTMPWKKKLKELKEESPTSF